MTTKKITLNELRSVVKQIIKEESEINKNIYLKDIDKHGVIDLINDKIVSYHIVSNSDGERYDKNTYSYIRTHFDDLVKNGRIKMS